ncbi:MAG: DUF5333 domain-containing protein [Roseinatronobacter sp.]
MKQTILRLTTVLLLASSAVATAATTQSQVNDALRGNPEIYNGLFTAALIKHVVDTCPAINPPGRLARVGYFLSLYNSARSMGYSRSQIEAFVEDDAEQARMRSLVEAHLRRAGVDPASETEVCAYARAEIAERSALGRQLREN